MIKVINAHFVRSCEKFSTAPSILGAEIAILGRSNVGKSSLINALLDNKNLAKSSSTPGKTKLINFFSAKWRIDSTKSQNLAESTLDSTNPQNLTRKAQNPQNLTRNSKSQNLTRKNTESTLDSTNPQNLTRSAKPCPARHAEATKSPKYPKKSFCYFWLLPKVESSIPYRLQLTKKGNFVDSTPKSAISLQQLSTAQEFTINILDFPGFGYAKVSKAEKRSWDRHLSEFLQKRDSIKLYVHLIDSRHQNLKIDDEIFAFLSRFKRGDSAILQVFTKADKLGKNELSLLKKRRKFYHSINDKNSTQILRQAILKIMYNVDF